MDNRKLQEKELNNVSGGVVNTTEVEMRRCQSCNTEFNWNTAENRKIGCSTDHDTVKCPGCGKWIDWDGEVQD